MRSTAGAMEKLWPSLRDWQFENQRGRAHDIVAGSALSEQERNAEKCERSLRVLSAPLENEHNCANVARQNTVRDLRQSSYSH